MSRTFLSSRASRGALALAVATLAGTLALALTAQASGAYRGQVRAPTPELSDDLYDRGKALYQGRNPDHRGLEICVPAAEDAEDPAPVVADRGTLRAYRRGPARDLILDLMRCEGEPQSRLLTEMEAEDFKALVHYLNQRYRLFLKS